MDVQNYGGVVDQLVAAIAAAGDHPNEVRRIVLTPAEMQELQDSGAFTTTVSKYYGQSDTLIIDNIVTDREGRYLSLYLGGILVVRHPSVPDFVAALTYPAGTPATETVFAIESGGKKYMLSGVGNPVDDFTLTKNANIEMGIAIRKRNDATNYGAGGTYDIALKPTELWTFAVTVGSLNADVKNVCELYNVELLLDVDPTGATDPIRWALIFDDKRQRYIWSNAVSGHVVIADAAMSADKTAVQMIQRYDFGFIKPYIQNAEYNEAGSPFGTFVLALKATPKWKAGTELEVEVMADVTEYVEPTPPA
jgi:hypothetical protein